jgi:hypothetical protein
MARIPLGLGEGRDISITSDEINCLVYAYLQDSGFLHSAFALRSEAHLDRTPLSAQPVRRGELIDLLAKALLYSEVEHHWQPDHENSICTAPFSLLSDHICSPNHRPPRHPPIAADFKPREVLQNGLKQPINDLNTSLRQAKISSPEPATTTLPRLEYDKEVEPVKIAETNPKIPVTLLQGHATEVTFFYYMISSLIFIGVRLLVESNRSTTSSDRVRLCLKLPHYQILIANIGLKMAL